MTTSKVVPFSRLILAKSGAFSSREYPKPATSDEEVLWRAVIDRALHDLGSDNNRIRQDAENWIDVLNEDFVEVCRLANVYPKEVIDFIAKHDKVLLEPQYDIEFDITIYLRIKRRERTYDYN
jgi:hypothetical protein